MDQTQGHCITEKIRLSHVSQKKVRANNVASLTEVLQFIFHGVISNEMNEHWLSLPAKIFHNLYMN